MRGCSRVALRMVALPYFEILILRFAVTERHARRTLPMRVEKRGFEPLALLGGIDERQKVLARRQAAHLIAPVLIGPRRHDVTRLRTPERLLRRKREDRVISHRNAAVRRDGARELCLRI